MEPAAVGRSLRRGALLLAAAGWFWCSAAAAAPVAPEAGENVACPPIAQAPTEEEIREGVGRARDRGFLWRLRRDGNTSYLYGTVHVGRKEWIAPGPLLRDAIGRTEVLAVELDFTAPGTMEAILASPRKHILQLDEAQRRRLSRQAASACIPPQVLGGLGPTMEVMAYVALAGRWDGLDPAYAQDAVLSWTAQAIGRPIVALETPEEQLAVVTPSDPARAARILEQMLKQLEQGQARSQMVRIAEAWARGDLAAIEQSPEWCECIETEADRVFLRELNDDRNVRFAQRIDALHAEGKPALVAVGALHMTGPQALPKLLAARGFEVQRLTPDTTGTAGQ